MTTLLMPREVEREREGDEGSTIHVVCWCDPDLAICGEDMADLEWCDTEDPADDACVVCIDLERLPCERCGA